MKYWICSSTHEKSIAVQEVIERDRDKGDEFQSAMTLLEVGSQH